MIKRIGTALAAAAAFSACAMLQAQDAKAPGSDSESLFVPEATIELKDVANVAARIGGVIQSVEIPEGVLVKKGDPIAFLYNKKAQLAVAKAEIAAKSEVGTLKADANREVAAAKLARAQNINSRSPGAVHKEEMEELIGQVKVAYAMVAEAKVEHDLATAELAIAQQVLEEHSIPAPFDGVVAELLKKPGDSVQEHEPVVRLVNLDTLRVFVYIPSKESFRLQQGDRAEIEPTIPLGAGGRKKIGAKVTFIDPEVQSVGEKTRRIYLEVDNKAAGYELLPGMACSVTIYPRSVAAAAARDVPVAPEALSKVRGN